MRTTVRGLLGVIGITAMLASCRPANPIPVIGLDENGEPALAEVSKDEYVGRLRTMAESIHDSAIEALGQQDSDARGWKLRTFTVGVGVSVEVGIGPVKVGAVPRSRLIFTNSTKPSVP